MLLKLTFVLVAIAASLASGYIPEDREGRGLLQFCNVPNCIRCVPNQNPPICQNCFEGFFNDNGKCIKCQTANCRVCQPPNGAQCTQCLQGFTFDHATGQCLNGPIQPNPPNSCDLNCVVCNNPPFCQNCKQGYWNDNGTCKKCFTPQCRVCQPPNGAQCTQCIDGYQINHQTGQCFFTGQGRKLAEATQQDCDGDMECEANFGRQLRQSNNCNSNVFMCDQCVFGQPQICQNCVPGYFNDNGTCVKCLTPNCQVCQPPNGAQCTQCKRPFTLDHPTGQCVFNGNGDPGTIVTNPTQPCGPNCDVCPNNGPFCQNCAQGYWNDNGFCKACSTQNCRVCQPNNGATCTQCLDGFNLVGNNCQ